MGNNRKTSRVSKKTLNLQKVQRMMQANRKHILGNKTNSNALEITGCEIYTPLQNVLPESCKDVKAPSFHEQSEKPIPKDFTRKQNIENVESLSDVRVYINKNKNKAINKKLIDRSGLSQCTDNRLDKNDTAEGGQERRIVDIFYFIEQLKSISDHPPFGCGFGNLIVISEKRFGLMSKILFECNMCRTKFTVNTCDPKPKHTMDVNVAAVSGMTPAGIGLAQLSELLTAVNIPPMSQKLFNKKNVLVSREWEKCALVAMEVAAERERQAAIEEGSLQDGVAVIDVIADGCWSKRSYRKNYTALSGAAAIIGRRFGEVLYLGVKNKYCCICARAENQGILPKEHK